jgi:hypothetical protein
LRNWAFEMATRAISSIVKVRRMDQFLSSEITKC